MTQLDLLGNIADDRDDYVKKYELSGYSKKRQDIIIKLFKKMEEHNKRIKERDSNG